MGVDRWTFFMGGRGSVVVYFRLSGQGGNFYGWLGVVGVDG